MNRMKLCSFVAVFAVLALQAQSAPVVSPEVHADGSVTFRYEDPAAKSVAVYLENQATTVPMHKGSDGVWTGDTQPLTPEYYGYLMVVDGRRVMDSRDPDVRPNLRTSSSVVHVTGAMPMAWDLTDIPHGETHHVLYESKLAHDDRDLYVYTPPGYDPNRKQPYPVLYLLHGYTDGAVGWLEVGKANLMMDSMLAQGKVQPMVVVMPRAYGTMQMMGPEGGYLPQRYGVAIDSQRKFTDQMLQEVLPLAEARYNIAHDAAHRALAGLSMGGGHSIATGVSHPEVFGYVGAFSPAIVAPSITRVGAKPGELADAAYAAGFAELVPHAATQPALRLLWTSCGTEDSLISEDRAFAAWAKANVKGNVMTRETPGAHFWVLWRDDLVAFAPLLFTK